MTQGELRLDRSSVARLLATQGISVDEDTVAAVEGWYRAWAREWETVRHLDLTEILPAPLWCWPP